MRGFTLKSMFARHVLKPDFESQVKVLGPPLSVLALRAF